MVPVLRSFSAVLILAACLLAPVPASAEQPVKCAECGMTVDTQSKFCAKIDQDGKTLMFCDLGDLLTYLNKKSVSPSAAQVRDYKTGEWIGAEKAFYVHAEKTFKTPMGWGIAAFKTKEDAAAFGTPVDITGSLKAVK
jgi:copper chaperone NosL